MRAKYVFEFEKKKDPFKSLDIGQSSEYLKEEQLKMLREIYEAMIDEAEDLDDIIKSFSERFGKNPDILKDTRIISSVFDNDNKNFQRFKIKLAELTKTEEEEIRDENYNLFVFLRYNDFIETRSGNYKKMFTFENLVSMRRYNMNDMMQVNYMKLRARTYGANSDAHIYSVNIPKHMLQGGKNYFPDNLKDNKKLLKYIEDNKFKI
jgi:hypothetical protein